MSDSLEQIVLDGWIRRFWLKVEKRDDGHWIWKGTRDTPKRKNFAYGLTRRNLILHGVDSNIHSHRIAWELVKGERLPSSARLFNSCGVSLCVNPDHWHRKDNLVPRTKRFLTRPTTTGEMIKRNEWIVKQRLRTPTPTMQEIADEAGVSRQRVEQIIRRYANNS
jgi:hypothetical protein